MRLLVGFLATWLLLSTGIVTVMTWNHPRPRAVLCMGWGLILLWVGLGGTLMHRFRDRVRELVSRIRMPWRVVFVLFCILLALAEEAVTTTMTNLAPLFGVEKGQAYITASANYLDVVTMHSVVVFVPMFVAWSWLLGRYRFEARHVFLLFGLTGLLAESLTFGLQHLAEFSLWIFVYGLMVYLPAYCVPTDRPAKPPRWWHYLLALFAPFLFELLVPTGLLIHLLDPNHPKIHFPPL